MRTIDYTMVDKVKPGMKIRAVGFRNSEQDITRWLDYEVIQVQEGIFPNRPFVQVVDDRGKPSGFWHLSRFALVEWLDE